MTKSKMLRVFGGAAIVCLSFLGTIVILDTVRPWWRNGTRADDARRMKAGLAGYYKKYNSYPGPAEIPVENLEKFLRPDGFLSGIPHDPLEGNPPYGYVSDGKTFYGLVIRLEGVWGGAEEGLCLTGVNTQTTRVFGDPPPRQCPF